MILGRNPVQGGSVVVRVSFKDEAGQVYVPVKGTCFYTLLAQKEDKEGWEVVRQWTSVPSASVVDVVLRGADLELLPSCTLKRRIVLGWEYLRAGEKILGRDMVDFEVTPLPVTDPPLGPPPPLPSPPPGQGYYEDSIDGLEGYDSDSDLSVRVADGFVKMSRGSVLAANVSGGLWAFVYSFIGQGEVLLIGVHGDTHEVGRPIFRVTVLLTGGKWLLARVDNNDLGLEAGTVFNFQPVS
jgi:hypothetical protein